MKSWFSRELDQTPNTVDVGGVWTGSGSGPRREADSLKLSRRQKESLWLCLLWRENSCWNLRRCGTKTRLSLVFVVEAQPKIYIFLPTTRFFPFPACTGGCSSWGSSPSAAFMTFSCSWWWGGPAETLSGFLISRVAVFRGALTSQPKWDFKELSAEAFSRNRVQLQWFVLEKKCKENKTTS